MALAKKGVRNTKSLGRRRATLPRSLIHHASSGEGVHPQGSRTGLDAAHCCRSGVSEPFVCLCCATRTRPRTRSSSEPSALLRCARSTQTGINTTTPVWTVQAANQKCRKRWWTPELQTCPLLLQHASQQVAHHLFLQQSLKLQHSSQQVADHLFPQQVATTFEITNCSLLNTDLLRVTKTQT